MESAIDAIISADHTGKTVIGQARPEPLYHHYQQLLDGGTKPNLARLTIARQIAAIALALWRNKEVYDQKKLAHTT